MDLLPVLQVTPERSSRVAIARRLPSDPLKGAIAETEDTGRGIEGLRRIGSFGEAHRGRGSFQRLGNGALLG